MEENVKLSKTLSGYYKTQVYADSISAYLLGMSLCLKFVGPKRIYMGTDYAQEVGNWEHAADFVTDLGLLEENTNDILGGNVPRIFKIRLVQIRF